MSGIDMSEILSAVIQAIGTISAAIIAAVFANIIVKKHSPSYFHSYEDKHHNLTDITRKAKNDIFIVAAIGGNLIERYIDEFEKYLQRGIEIKYLILDNEYIYVLEKYLHGKNFPEFEEAVRVARERLRKLENEYPDLFEVREFHSFFTASYIGIDIWKTPDDYSDSRNSVIQTMLYQYNIGTEKSPITYISPKNDYKQYQTTVKSMKEMWNDSDDIFLADKMAGRQNK